MQARASAVKLGYSGRPKSALGLRYSQVLYPLYSGRSRCVRRFAAWGYFRLTEDSVTPGAVITKFDCIFSVSVPHTKYSIPFCRRTGEPGVLCSEL